MKKDMIILRFSLAMLIRVAWQFFFATPMGVAWQAFHVEYAPIDPSHDSGVAHLAVPMHVTRKVICHTTRIGIAKRVINKNKRWVGLKSGWG